MGAVVRRCLEKMTDKKAALSIHNLPLIFIQIILPGAFA
jgi:hypothetical protein